MDKLSQSPSFFNEGDESSARKDIDAILFDVDGVLIDTRLSYNLAIKKTVKHVLAIVSSVEPIQSVSDSILLRMRRTGGFNNDTDTTYALILTSLVSQSTSTKELESLLFDITNKIDAGGIISVERYLSTLFSRTAIQKIKHELSYPGPVGRSLVTTVFDEVFYGAELFKQRYGICPQYYFGDALINNEKVVITRHVLQDSCPKDLTIGSELFQVGVNWPLSTLFERYCQLLTERHVYFWKTNQEKMQNLILTGLRKQ